MTNLDNATEKKILEIVEKYQKDNRGLLNYLITDGEITFFSTINNGSDISDEDLGKIAEILGGSFINREIINQEYRFKFSLSE